MQRHMIIICYKYYKQQRYDVIHMTLTTILKSVAVCYTN
jgi:hypothetical protein